MVKNILLSLLLLLNTANAGTRTVDADSLRSSDHTKTWSLPSATDTLAGRAAVETFSGAKNFSATPTFSTMTVGSLLFAGTGGLLSQNNTALKWDDANTKMTIKAGSSNIDQFCLNSSGATGFCFGTIGTGSGGLFLESGATVYDFYTAGWHSFGAAGAAPKFAFDFNQTASGTAPLTEIIYNSGAFNLAGLAVRNFSNTVNSYSFVAFSGGNGTQNPDAALVAVHEDLTAGAESGHLDVNVRNAGTMVKALSINKDKTISAFGALDMGSSKITSVTDPTSAQDAATKNYVDTVVPGEVPAKDAVNFATTAALPTVVYSNGSSGVGATLTAVGVGALSMDGGAPSVGQRLLIKNQVSTFQNGIYTVTAAGSGIAVFVLTRATDYDQSSEAQAGSSALVISGTTYASTVWDQNSASSPTIGTDAITFVQTAGPGSVTGGNGITVTGSSVAMTDMANSTIKCRVGAGTGAPQDCTGAQATTILSAFVGDSGSGGQKGLVPAPAAGDAAALKFLKADGTYAVPSGSGSVIKVATFFTAASTTGTTQTPMDDTIPQSSEGDQYMALQYTPSSAADRLKIDVHWAGANSASGQITCAIFSGTNASAWAANSMGQAGDDFRVIPVSYITDPIGSTAASVFKVRCGNNGGGTTTMNGRSGSRQLGGSMLSSITVTEIAP